MSKKVLITGANGYVGNKLSRYLLSQSYDVKTLSVRNDDWKNEDFSQYDAIIHLAALVHNNEPGADMKRYMDVNYKLTKLLADKAKQQQVPQFIFFSTMAVFGLDGKLGSPEKIDNNTILDPKTEYGISKLKADEYLLSIEDDNFVVSIVRPPMIYGEDSPGNFKKLKKYAEHIPFYLNIDNERSAINIDNLVLYVGELIKHKQTGIHYPYDNESFKTNEVIKEIRNYNNKNSYAIVVPKFLLPLLSKLSVFNKLYGNLTYDNMFNDKETSGKFVGLKDSIRKSI